MSKRPDCKTLCGKTSKIEGWCAVCYSRFKRGYYTSTGAISPEILKKQKEKQAKQAKKEARIEVKRREFIKEELSNKLTSNHLKILSDAQPGVTQPQYCEALSFWTSDVVCYSRLFIAKHKKCAKCKVHEHKLSDLFLFMENCNGNQSTAPTEPQDKAADEPNPATRDEPTSTSTTAATITGGT